ncbi:MAG: pyruvate carboxyltransferase, partial [Opitutales bacterium]
VHKHMDDLKKELEAKNFPSDPEHCVIHAMFPPQLEAHLKGTNKPKPVVKPAETPKPEPTAAVPKSSGGPKKTYGLTINGRRIEVGVEEII